MVAPAGAEPCPQITSTLSLRTSYTSTGTSPPGPLRCGSTTCRVKAVATAASKALPPRSSVPMPTAVAIQWVEATTPKVPSISGRVVKGLGLMLLIGVLRGGAFFVQSHLTTPDAPDQPRHTHAPTVCHPSSVVCSCTFGPANLAAGPPLLL